MTQAISISFEQHRHPTGENPYRCVALRSNVVPFKQHTRGLDCRLRQTDPVAVHEQSIEFNDAGPFHDHLVFVDAHGTTVGADLRLSTDVFAYVGPTGDQTLASSQGHGWRAQNRGPLTQLPFPALNFLLDGTSSFADVQPQSIGRIRSADACEYHAVEGHVAR